MALIKRDQLAVMNQHYRRFSLDYFLDCQQRVGFTNIELWCGAAHFWLHSDGYEDVQPLKKKLRDRGLSVVSLVCPSVAYQYQYAAQEPFHLERSFQYFANGIHLAAELEAKILGINSGWGYNGENSQEMWNRSKENIQRLCDLAEREGITLVMESMRADETNLVNSLESAVRMHREVNHPALKIMVDTIATGANGETLEDWFEAFGSDLVHMHFLDGDPYLHNIWGDGNTPLCEQLQTMNDFGFTGYLVQEVADEHYFSDPFEADVKNMRVLERFLED